MSKKAYISLALVGMIFLGLADLFMKKALNLGINYIPLTFLLYAFTTLFIGIYCLVKGYSFKINIPIMFYSIAIGLIIFIATVLSLIALKTGNASVIIPIVRMSFVVTAVLAFVILREKLTLHKALGLFFAITSLILLSQ